MYSNLSDKLQEKQPKKKRNRREKKVKNPKDSKIRKIEKKETLDAKSKKTPIAGNLLPRNDIFFNVQSKAQELFNSAMQLEKQADKVVNNPVKESYFFAEACKLYKKAFS